MKRFLFLLILLIAVPAFGWETWQATGTLTGGVVSDNTTVTINLPDFIGKTAYLYIPAITSATVAIHGFVGNASTGYALWEYQSGTNPVAWITASTSGDIILRLPDISPFQKIKIVCGAAQPANKTFILFGTGRGN